MRLEDVLSNIISPAIGLLPPEKNMGARPALICMLAIGLQESRFEHRWQIVDPQQPGKKGPARGFWQFEKGGGVKGVLRHTASRVMAEAVCAERGVAPEDAAVWEKLDDDDILAAAFARLLLWTDPKTLPAPGEEEGAWQLYLRAWRPGAYWYGTDAAKTNLRAKWAQNYAAALGAA